MTRGMIRIPGTPSNQRPMSLIAFRATAVPPSWRTPTASALAQDPYDRKTFDRLPILADALEDAGCIDADLLGYLLGPGLHVRGCWALDLLFAKE
jgi:hypothetical protein